MSQVFDDLVAQLREQNRLAENVKIEVQKMTGSEAMNRVIGRTKRRKSEAEWGAKVGRPKKKKYPIDDYDPQNPRTILAQGTMLGADRFTLKKGSVIEVRLPSGERLFLMPYQDVLVANLIYTDGETSDDNSENRTPPREQSEAPGDDSQRD